MSDITKEDATITVVASEVMKKLSVDLPQLASSAVAAAIKDTEPPPAPSTQPWPNRNQRYIGYEYKDLSRMVLNPIQQSSFWRVGKGARLGASWMTRPDSQNKLFIEQYGSECSVLRKLGVPQKLENGQNLAFDRFQFADGTISEVMAKFEGQGWKQAVPPLKTQPQLALLEGVTS